MVVYRGKIKFVPINSSYPLVLFLAWPYACHKHKNGYMEKFEACIFLNPWFLWFLIMYKGVSLNLWKKDALLSCLAAAIAHVNCACSQLLGLRVWLDTQGLFMVMYYHV
jgi:hypothetical protein